MTVFRPSSLFLALLALIGVGLGPAPAQTPRAKAPASAPSAAVAAQPDPVPVEGIAQRLVRLKTKDGAEIAAFLTTPASGMNPMSPGIVFHHGGLGGHPTRLVGAPRFAAERLAAKGYTTLSLLSRTSNDWVDPRVEETALDIEAAIDFLSANMIDQIVLAGHSFGSIKISYYQATRQDPRVKALLHWAPTADTAEFQRAQIGDAAYFARLDLAARALARGQGEIDLSPDPSRRQGIAMEPVVDMGAQFMSGRAWLEWWGPATRLRNSDRMAEIAQPMLLMSGDKDAFVPDGRLEALKKAAVKSPRTAVIRYPGGDHEFTAFRQQSSDDAANFLAENGLAPRGAIVERLVDAKLDGGERFFPAVLTLPADGSATGRPLFIVLQAWRASILESSSRWLPERLAAQGFAALAPMLRVSGLSGTVSATLEQTAADLRGWIDFAAAQGYGGVVIVGEESGGLWASHYQATSQDARVKGIVYLSPARDFPERARAAAGPERYDQIVEAAQQAVAAGKGKEAWILEKYYLPPPAPPELGLRGFWAQKAESWLDLWGPDAKTVHTDRIREVRVPILAVAAAGDPLVDKDYLTRFARSARGPAQMIWYEEATPRGFQGAEDRAAADILAWTRTQLRVR